MERKLNTIALHPLPEGNGFTAQNYDKNTNHNDTDIKKSHTMSMGGLGIVD